MIEYDYELVRTTGKEIEIYRPSEIPRILPNCVDINGKNSIGKSTLLHIIASGLHGIDNEKIHPTLRKKMGNILNSSHQKLTFKIKIKSHDDTLELISEKLDPEKLEIVTHEIINGKSSMLSPTEFRGKYNLIYDIPESPTDRLKEFTREIQDIQRIYANRLQVLNEFIRRNVSEINNKDPKRLMELERQLKKLNDDNIILSKEIDLSENNIRLLEYATSKKYIEEYRIKASNTEAILKKVSKSESSTKAKEEKFNKEYKKTLQEAKHRIDLLISVFDKTACLLRELVPENEKYNLDIWEKIDIENMGKNFIIDPDFRSLIVKFMSILRNIQDKNKEAFQKIELCQDLKSLLIRYDSSNIIIPGIELSIPGFIEILDQSITSNDNLTEDNENIKKCIALLGQMTMPFNDLEEKYFPKIKDMTKIKREKEIDAHKPAEYESLEEDTDQLQKRLDSYMTRYDFYRGEMSRTDDIEDDNIEIGTGKLTKYAKYSEEELSKEIALLRGDILEKKGTRNYNKGIMSRLESDIQNLKKLKSNKYENQKEILDKLLLIAESLERKFRVDFQSYLEKLSGGLYSKKEDVINLKQKDYYDALFSYLGKRVGTIRHIDKEYDVEYIDLINNCFASKEGETINFLDMGTGQGQLAYLLGLLNTQDDRKIIVLLDEVAMMDNTTLEAIHEKIRELYNENRLLVGIIVQAQREIGQAKISKI